MDNTLFFILLSLLFVIVILSLYSYIKRQKKYSNNIPETVGTPKKYAVPYSKERILEFLQFKNINDTLYYKIDLNDKVLITFSGIVRFSQSITPVTYQIKFNSSTVEDSTITVELYDQVNVQLILRLDTELNEFFVKKINAIRIE